MKNHIAWCIASAVLVTIPHFAIPSDDIALPLVNGAKSATSPTTSATVSRRASSGSTAWGKSRWGMTLGDLKDLYAEFGLRTVNERGIAEQKGSNIIIAILSQYAIGAHKFNVFFFVDRENHRLTRVSISPSEEDVKAGCVTAMLPDLARKLLLKYGRPDIEKGSVEKNSLTYTWRKGETVIILSGFGNNGDDDKAFMNRTFPGAGFAPTSSNDHRRHYIEQHYLSLDYTWQKPTDDEL